MNIALAQKEQTLRQDVKLVLSTLVLLCIDILVCYPSTAIYFVFGVVAMGLSQVKFLHSKRKIACLMLALVGGFLFINTWVEPAHSILLSNVQTHFSSILSQGGDDSATYAKMTDMIFNTARVMYVIFLLFVTWQGFRNFQQGEEMSELVRMGVYSVVAVLAVDVVSQFVIGTAAA